MNKNLSRINNKHTTCSVVMAVYKKDQSQWFQLAIDSILHQTLKTNDLVIVRDGIVPDDLERVLLSYEKADKITVVRLKDSVGAGEARNIGLRLAKNDLVAIMDADDISVPERLRLQIEAFNNDPQLTVVGGQIAEFEGDITNVVSYRNVPVAHEDLVKFSKRRSPFNNMTVCVNRVHVLKAGGYKKSTRAEDYNLWLEVLASGMKVRNLMNVLCYVRIDDDAVGRRMTLEQATELLKLRVKFFKRKYIGILDLIIACSANILILLLPKSAVRLIYKKALRT